MPIEKPAHGWIPMLFIGMGTALIIMDATIVNVSLPSMIADLGLSSIDAEWVNAVYSLTFAALLIVFGRVGDRVGRRRIFTLGALVFVLASIYAASSRSGEHLITARALQGIGGAMMSPTSLSLVNSLYAGRARNIAFAIYGSIIGGMAALGPLVGGYLTTNFSWTWAFWINVPIGLIVIAGALRFVPESKDPGDTQGLDVLGAILSALGIGLIVFGLIEGRNYGWTRVEEDRNLFGRQFSAGDVSPVAIALALGLSVPAGALRAGDPTHPGGEVRPDRLHPLPHRHVRPGLDGGADRQPRRVRHPVLAAPVPDQRDEVAA